jgi:hypothetical protein
MRSLRAFGALFVVLLGMQQVALAAPGVTPDTVNETLAQGASTTVTKTVETPTVAPRADVYFLADTTGSMGAALNNVKANGAAIIDALATSGSDVAYGAGQYKDFPSDAFAFKDDAGGISDDGGAAAAAAISVWSASGGNDTPEGQFYALDQLAKGAANFRSGASRIVVWFGDAPAHDPVCSAISGLPYDITEASLTADLVSAEIQVIAVSTPTGVSGALDANPGSAGNYLSACGAETSGTAGQATRIAEATSGKHLVAATPDEVADLIIEALTSLSMTIVPVADCDAGLSVTFDNASQTVDAGATTTFEETISVASDAPSGTLTCRVDFQINGAVGAEGFGQLITIQVPAVAVAGAVETTTTTGAAAAVATPRLTG